MTDKNYTPSYPEEFRQLLFFNAALAAMQTGQNLTGKDGILTPLIKQLTEAALKAELDNHLADLKEGNPLPNRKTG